MFCLIWRNFEYYKAILDIISFYWISFYMTCLKMILNIFLKIKNYLLETNIIAFQLHVETIVVSNLFLY